MEEFEAKLKSFAESMHAILVDETIGSRAALIAPAHLMTPVLFAKFLNLSAGLPFVALSNERATKFLLPAMPGARVGSTQQASYVSVEAREGVRSGISATDRAKTISLLGELEPEPWKLVKPGHIFPIPTREGGVLVNAELPEGALDLVRLIGETDAALVMEILSECGDLLASGEAEELSNNLLIPIFRLSELIRYRLRKERLVVRSSETVIPNRFGGELRAYVYRTPFSGGEHIALVKGAISSDQPVLVRVQSERTFTDVFRDKQIEPALTQIAQATSGVLVYLRRPIFGGLVSEIEGLRSGDAPKAHIMRDYGVGAEILRDLGVKKIVLLTDNPRTIRGLSNFNLEIVGNRPIKEDSINSRIDT